MTFSRNIVLYNNYIFSSFFSAKYLELYFLSRENHIPTLSSGVDISSPNVTRLLKKVSISCNTHYEM